MFQVRISDKSYQRILKIEKLNCQISRSRGACNAFDFDGVIAFLPCAEGVGEYRDSGEGVSGTERVSNTPSRLRRTPPPLRGKGETYSKYYCKTFTGQSLPSLAINVSALPSPVIS